MTTIQPISFKGKFIKIDKFKGNTAKFVHEIINKKSDGVSNKELLEKLPFNIEIYRTNKSHKAIHPQIYCSINYDRFWGKQSYYVEHGSDNAISKIRKWMNNFNEFMNVNKNKMSLTPKEENDRIYDFIRNFGKITHYKPLQRH